LANEIPSEIISADSRQIFKYMDIGTDKVPLEIREKIPHHQIDIITPDQNYTAGQRKADTEKNIQEIQKRNKLPIIVGGTGLYIDTIYKNFSMPKGEPNPTLRDELYEKEKLQP
jgi:tRNA dimethylallyltransferase